VGARYPVPRRGAELHKPRTLYSGRGSERGNAVVRLHPHPAEWRIGSPLIEAAWYDAAHPERNNGVSHGNPKRGDARPIVFVACPDNGITEEKTGTDEQAFLRVHSR
jgi:hypothetical protein